MTRNEPHFYVLRVANAENIPDNLTYHFEQNDLYISAANRLCGFHKMAYIETEKLAEEFKEFCLEKFNGKYGNNITIKVEGTQDGCYHISKPSIKRMSRDTEKISCTVLHWKNE